MTSTSKDETMLERVFRASTLSRALGFEASEMSVKSSISETVERWFQKKPALPPNFEHNFEVFLKDVVRVKKLKHMPEIPHPSTKACLELSSPKGGTAATMYHQMTRYYLQKLEESGVWDESQYYEDDGSDIQFARTMDPSWAAIAESGETVPTLRNLLGSIVNSQAEDAWELAMLASDIIHGTPRPPTKIETFRIYQSLLDEQGVTPLKPLAIKEMGGKVRVATMHPAVEIQMARWLTKIWLPVLKKANMSRDMLHGNDFLILKHDKRFRNSFLYSADLSAATDHISHHLAQTAGKILNKCLGIDELPLFDTLIKNLFGPHSVNEKLTKCGIHMGLGPSWTILSLLNGYAAYMAKCRTDTYRICGDDLIGFWNETQVQAYEENLHALGLVVNTSKSFRGSHGVFAERLATITGDHQPIAYIRDVGHLAIAGASKYVSKQSNASLPILDLLRETKVDHALVKDTQRRILKNYRSTGPTFLGGTGHGKATWCQLDYHIQHGGVGYAKTYSDECIIPSGLHKAFIDYIKLNPRDIPVGTQKSVADYIPSERALAAILKVDDYIYTCQKRPKSVAPKGVKDLRAYTHRVQRSTSQGAKVRVLNHYLGKKELSSEDKQKLKALYYQRASSRRLRGYITQLAQRDVSVVYGPDVMHYIQDRYDAESWVGKLDVKAEPSIRKHLGTLRRGEAIVGVR
jgi:hypothetical protein